MKFKKLGALAAATAVSIGLAGCSMFTSPDQELREAFDQQQKLTAQSVTIDLDVTPEQLAEISNSGGNDPTDKVALDALANGNFIFESKSTDGKPLSESTNLETTDFAMAVSIENTDVINITKVGEQWFAKTDVNKIADKTGSKEDLKGMIEALEQFPAPGVKALMDGKWIVADETISSKIKLTTSNNEQYGTLSNPENKERVDRVKTVAFTQSKITKEGDVITMDIPVKKVLETSKEDINAILNSAKQSAQEEALDIEPEKQDIQETIDKLNDNTLKVDFTVKDKNIKQLKVDILELRELLNPEKLDAEEKADIERLKDKDLPILINMDERTNRVVKHDDAVEFTESEAMILLGGLMSGPSEDDYYPGPIEENEPEAIPSEPNR